MINVSIVIPIKNEEKKIEKCIQNVLDRIDESFELILVDDGSSDNSYEIARAYSKRNRCISLYRLNKSEGAGKARNIGINYARGKYLYFLDADDEFVGGDIIKKLCKKADYSNCKICGGSFLLKDKNGEKMSDIEYNYAYTFTEEKRINYRDYQFDYGYTRFIYNTDFIREYDIKFPSLLRYQDPPFMVNAFWVAQEFYAIKDVTYICNVHEKKVWLENEIRDLFKGIYENIKYSSKYNLTCLFKINILRIFNDFGEQWYRAKLEGYEIIKRIEQKINLQKIILPQKKYCMEDELFYHNLQGDFFVDEKLTIHLFPNSELDFNSYFNSFSCSKWKKYTNVKTVGLYLRVFGTFEISLYHNRILYGIEHHTLFEKRRFSLNKEGYIVLEFPELNEVGNFSFSIKSIGTIGKIYEGSYICNSICTSKNIKCALIFCTYKREKNIKKNLNSILDLNDDRIKTYIVDNASSLDQIEKERYCIIHNKNVGGAGGFARGMLQVIKDSQIKYTHCILMDDDVLVDPQIIERLMCFLSRINENWDQSFIGGAMLRTDLKYYQVEAGAVWNNGYIQSIGHGLDFRKTYNCLLNEFDTYIDYNAWWFCTIPIQYIRADNLPLPIFTFNDDSDYGLRNSNSKIILLNGLCVWHETFETKLSASRLYYECRNRLIVNSIHQIKQSPRKIARQIKKDIFTEILLYRYANAHAILSGVEDFLLGPDWLCSIDAEKYNEEVLSKNEKIVDVQELNCQFDYQWFRLCCTIKDCDMLHKIVRLISLNGILLKANRDIILPLYANKPVQAYRARRVLYYDEISNRGYICKKDFSKMLCCLKHYCRVKKKLHYKLKITIKQYFEKYKYLISNQQWERYLWKL